MQKKFRWRFQYDEDSEGIEAAKTAIVFTEPSLTQQHFKADTDLNVIVKRFGIGKNPIPPASDDPRFYGDFLEATDFRTALDRTREAQHRFNELPAELRSRFNNDPGQLLEFVMNPENAEKAVELKLLKKRTPPPTVPEKTPE